VDTELSCKLEIGRLVVGWAEIAHFRVKATTVIETFNAVKTTLTWLGSPEITWMENYFLFQTAKETFDKNVMPTVASAAHTAEHAALSQQLLEIPAGIL
jgi:hypothetical protein